MLQKRRRTINAQLKSRYSRSFTLFIVRPIYYINRCPMEETKFQNSPTMNRISKYTARHPYRSFSNMLLLISVFIYDQPYLLKFVRGIRKMVRGMRQPITSPTRE